MFEAFNPHMNAEVIKELGLHVTHIQPAVESLGDAASINRTTIIYRPRRSDKHTIEVATAVCSATDSYDRKKGTALALGRWLRGNRVKLPARRTRQSDHSLLLSYFS